MPFIRAGDITVHYLIEGPESAPVVMLSNSLGTSLAIWDAQATHLRSKYRVLRYDTRGHGLTDAPPAGNTGYTMAQLADDAIALVKALGLKRVHFGGLSIGGMLGQNFAAKAPQLVASLMLVDTASTMPGAVWDERIAAIRKDGIEALADATMQRWFTRRFHEHNPDALKGIRNMLVRTPAEGYIGCSYAIRDMDLRGDDANILCPTLILVGEEDPATPVASARALNAAIQGSRLVIIPQAAHIVTVEQPAAVSRALGEFLGGQ
jgi:3-oxoadipate enol-lactonase